MNAREYEGCGVHEVFIDEFLDEITRNARAQANYQYALNRPAMSDVSLACENASASEFIKFVTALKLQIEINGIAIIFCYAWHAIGEIYVVCGE